MEPNSILVIDDDGIFRAVVSELLRSRGLNVIEARTGREALALLNSGNPILALVDFRLPEIDGISWITKVRELGRKFPIVFISGSWCDQKTFTKLRNLLQVSLILQKPIVPDLFFEQISSLLPPQVLERAVPPPPPSIEAPLPYVEESNDEPGAAALSQRSRDLLAPLKQLRSREERQQNLLILQEQYASELVDQWTALSQAILVAREAPDDRLALNEAMTLSHRLRGTAGSVGFRQTGEAAGKIEELLNRLDPTDTLAEVIWTEVFRFLAEGESALRETNQVKNPFDFSSGAVLKRILLWGREEQYKSLGASFKTADSTEIDLEICEGWAGLLSKSKQKVYQAAIFDLSMEKPDRIIDAASQLRELTSYRAIPLACILPPGTEIGREDLVLAGFSVMVTGEPGKSEIEEACTALLSISQISTPRILTVDDDSVLTQFISTILTAEEMTVRTLNSPILIMETMDEFKPDLVLLDVMMPGLSGYDVCRMLRSHETWKNVAIVFVTSKSDQDGRGAAFHAGGDDFLSKPVLAEELITRVRSQIHRAQLRKGTGDRDPVSGALGGVEFINEAIFYLENSGESPLSICLLSLDDFSHTSIVHGIFGAKEAVTALGRLIQQHFKTEDLRGKIGEDTFVLAFPGEEQFAIGKAMEKLLLQFSDVKRSSDSMGSFKATFSAGVAQYPQDGSTMQELLNTANERMLRGRQAKSGSISYAGASTR